jgi:hypothetical protein
MLEIMDQLRAAKDPECQAAIDALGATLRDAEHFIAYCVLKCMMRDFAFDDLEIAEKYPRAVEYAQLHL